MRLPKVLPKNAKLLPLSQGRFAIVDEDFQSDKKWSYHASDGYAIRLENGKTVELHREVCSGKYVDHINGNKLDCRKENLRGTNNSNNQRNKPKQKNNTSGYKGVSYNKEKGKFSAKIQSNGRLIHIGYFDTEEEAAKAYDERAKDTHGEYGRLNFEE